MLTWKLLALLPLTGVLITGVAGLGSQPTGAVKQTATLTDSLKIDAETGLLDAPGLPLVVAHCTGCHSTKLIQQHRFTPAGWTERIRWMQKYHKLWALGDAEKPIVAYLSAHYGPAPPRAQGRRAPLTGVAWYRL